MPRRGEKPAIIILPRPHEIVLLSFLAFTVLASADRVLQEDYPRQFQLLPNEQINALLLDWKDTYSNFVDLTTSQEKYGLPRAGGVDDCPFDEGDGCLNYVLTIQDYVSHPEGSLSSNTLPEVFWSGALHGDERVGPTSVMETTKLLLEAASCEALPRDDNDVEQAKACRSELERRGISNKQRQWLARLVATRRIIVVPTANALGYYRNEREEAGVDLNRDFPYDVLDSTLCMQTIGARTINEIFRDHLIQIAFTFHGGTEVIAYEWGAPTWTTWLSPDHYSQSDIAQAYSSYGGSFGSSPEYVTGTMSDLVYDVRGGMEDWAYAASWDSAQVIECNPPTYGGYQAEKTIYNESVLRAFNMLVEVSNDKIPSMYQLGTTQDVLGSYSAGNGYVSRCIRLSMLSADIVEPYVSIFGVNGVLISDDVVPSMEHSCETVSTIVVPLADSEVTVRWTVGGALTIDDSQAWAAKASGFPETFFFDCATQPKLDDVQSFFTTGRITTESSGNGYFSAGGAQPIGENVLGPVFAATFDISSLAVGDELIVIASARVDGAWANQPDNIGPVVPPQAHIVNARTNPIWIHENNGKIIQGRLEWFSVPIKIVKQDVEAAHEAYNRLEPRTMTPTTTPVTVAASGSPTAATTPLSTVSPSVAPATIATTGSPTSATNPISRSPVFNIFPTPAPSKVLIETPAPTAALEVAAPTNSPYAYILATTEAPMVAPTNTPYTRRPTPSSAPSTVAGLVGNSAMLLGVLLAAYNL